MSRRRSSPIDLDLDQIVDQAMEGIQRELIEKLRSNSLNDSEAGYLATKLEALLFPRSKAVKEAKERFRQSVAKLYRHEIDCIAAAENISKADAKKKVVEKNKLQSVEALETYIRRASTTKNK